MAKEEPLVVINFKTYKQGKEAVDLAKEIDKASKEIENEVIIGVQASDIYEVTDKTDLTVYSQHVDPVKPGRHTGYIVPEAVKDDGAVGTFLNHSEHRIGYQTIKKSMDVCEETGLKTMVFVANINEAIEIERLGPDYLVFEPPELVAGDKSVSKAKPELIQKVSEAIGMSFLVGAGINSKKDVKKAIELGASGVAIASAICKAEKPGEKLKRLVRVQ